MKKFFFRKELKFLYKPFIFFFLLGFLIFNWSDICLIFPYFNYRVIGAKISPLVKWLGPQGIEAVFKEENIIKIPQLKIEAPIGFSEEKNEKEFKEILNRGVLHYPDSALPGEKGIAIILGHSAPPGWPKINYDRIFNDLKELKKGGKIYIYFNHQRLVYQVEEKFFLEKGEEIPQTDGLTNSKSELVLLSCWPPGQSQQRIAIKAVLVN